MMSGDRIAVLLPETDTELKEKFKIPWKENRQEKELK